VALAAASGELIAFLDSDDEWPAHHLALMHAFFESHPGEQVATTEWWEDFGNGTHLQHFMLEMSEWYPATGRRIGSARFKSPPPSGDPVLWFYETREPLGEWAREAVGEPVWKGARHYRGKIFESSRYGWLTALQPTVLTRTALATVGRFDERYKVASDFTFLGRLFKAFPMNFFTVLGCLKHEYGVGGKAIGEGHLVTGNSAMTFHADVLRGFEELYLPSDDAELHALRGFRQSLAAKAALRRGERAQAQEWLESASRTYPGFDTSALLMLARAELEPRASAAIYDSATFALALPRRVRGAFARLAGEARLR
jgi:hypothetical protein